MWSKHLAFRKKLFLSSALPWQDLLPRNLTVSPLKNISGSKKNDCPFDKAPLLGKKGYTPEN